MDGLEIFAHAALKPVVIQSELQMVTGTNVEIIRLLMNIPQKVVYRQIRSLCCQVRALSVKSGL